jgi:excisionase family DNA binding protein
MLGAQNNSMDSFKYMTVQMLGQYIHISKSHIYKLVGRNKIPYLKLTRGVRFDKDEIDRWINNNCNMDYDTPPLPKI